MKCSRLSKSFSDFKATITQSRADREVAKDPQSALLKRLGSCLALGPVADLLSGDDLLCIVWWMIHQH